MRAYYSYVALMHFAYGLRIPISVLWRLEQGLTLAEVGLLVTVFWVVLFVLEVPSGMVADRFGRKTTIAAGALAAAGSFLLMSVAESFGSFLIESVFSAAAFALTSGAGEAYVFDWLKERGKEKAYKKAWSRVMMLDELATIVGALTTSAILFWLSFEWSYRVGAVSLALAALVIIFFLRESKQHVPSEENVIEDFEMHPVKSFQKAKNFLLSHKQFAGVFAAFALIEFPARILWQPQLVRIGFEESQMGVVYSVFKVFALVGAYVAGHKKIQVSIRHFVWIGLFGMVIQLAMGATSLVWLTLIGFSVYFAYENVWRIFRSDFINHRIDSKDRATVLSVNSFVSGVFGAVAVSPIGWLAQLSLAASFGILAGLKFISAGLLLSVQRKGDPSDL